MNSDLKTNWLYNIIKDGTLVDNQWYTVDEGKLNNRHLKEPISLATKKERQWSYPFNNEADIWCFLNRVFRDVEKELKKAKDNIGEALVRFNDEDYEHNTDDAFISITGTDARNFTLHTGNLIGLVKQGGYSLKISSRFGDEFLKFIIADADGFLEIKNMGGESESENGYKWLLAYLWNIKFKRAYRLGLPKAYITRNDRLSRVRGTIDAADFFRNKTSGKYLCSYREHSYDSPATSLFIKAYETVASYSFCQRTRNIYNALLVANQGVKRSQQEILRTAYFTNPFFNDYNELINLSKRVIRQQRQDIDSEQDSSSFFFDISMLFEYFIRKLMKRNGIHLLNKNERRYEIPTGAFGSYKRKLEPDLVFERDDCLYIFDVKYKVYDRKYGVRREDLFQLHTYIGQCANNAKIIKGCGFIYPTSKGDCDEGQSSNPISDVIHQHDNEIPFHVIFLKIPDNGANDFHQLMRKECDEFIDTMLSLVSG
ncbi:MAG: restriction endonuclease [Gammaproteobacteria bacterium]|nr:restriction endonuclease [Gammaproteobacteria bacterium]